MSLRDALFDLAQSARARRPADVQAVIDAALDELNRSGIEATCLQRGETAPDFTLPAASGGAVSLEALLRHGPAVVAFYRGGWCPYCNLALRAMDALVAPLRGLGASLVAVAPQRIEAQRETVGEHALGFPLLADPGNRVARLFGLAYPMPDSLVMLYRSLGLDLAAANGSAAWELPLPATYVIARDGSVAEAYIDIDYTKRAEPADILAAVMRLATESVA
ncbi:MAG: AhpC/TSA family protein [Rhodospirillales bacterium]|nr:AhpC/TSA family protein [Rhodospirillales bacterium]